MSRDPQGVARTIKPRNFQNAICACLAYWMIPDSAWRYWRLSDSFFSDRCSEDCQCFWMARTTPFPWRDLHPHLIMVPLAHLSLCPKRHLDRFSCFCMGPKCYAVQCIVSGEGNPQNCPFLLRFRHPTGRGSSHGIGNTQDKWVKIARVIREICSRTDRHTHRHAHHNTLPPLLPAK